jgi:hypothetical protein
MGGVPVLLRFKLLRRRWWNSLPLQTKSPAKRRGFKNLEKAQNCRLNHLD